MGGEGKIYCFITPAYIIHYPPPRSCDIRALKLREVDHALQDAFEIRIADADTIEQLATQILDGWGNAVEKIGLALKIASQSVGAQHLQDAEEHKEMEFGAESIFVKRTDLMQFCEVFSNHGFSEHLRITRRSLPKEGGEVVLQWPYLSALEIYEAR